MQHPFDSCWWLKEGRLLAGRYPGSPNEAERQEMIRSLVEDFKINSFISFQERDERNRHGDLFPDYMRDVLKYSKDVHTVTFRRFPVKDRTLFKHAEVVMIVDYIDTLLAMGQNIYFHCWGGHGRTGMIAAAWRIKHGADCKTVIDDINDDRAGRGFKQPIPTTVGQTMFIENFKYVEQSEKSQEET